MKIETEINMDKVIQEITKQINKDKIVSQISKDIIKQVKADDEIEKYAKLYVETYLKENGLLSFIRKTIRGEVKRYLSKR